jgi:hypothetical protein
VNGAWNRADLRPCRTDGFPLSAAYVVDPVAVQVTAAGLIAVYPQMVMLELIADGVERREASALCWGMFNQLLRGINPRMETVQPADRGRVNCLGASAGAMTKALGMDWQEFADKIGGPRAPVAWLHPEDRARLVWLVDTVRRVSQGVLDLGEAARGAHDQAIGKPRQRRAPADIDWVRDEVDKAAWSAWYALLQARFYPAGPSGFTQAGGMWLAHLGDLADEQHRPRVSQGVVPRGTQ